MSHTKQTYVRAFTLVELIVVIVILAILATIAFLSFSSQSSSARDSTRMADMSSITKWLGVFSATSWKYPIPDSSIDIFSWGTQIWYQWFAWKNTLKMIKLSSWWWKDPLDGTLYTYNTNYTQNKTQLVWFLENRWSYQVWFNPYNIDFNLSYNQYCKD